MEGGRGLSKYGEVVKAGESARKGYRISSFWSSSFSVNLAFHHRKLDAVGGGEESW